MPNLDVVIVNEIPHCDMNYILDLFNKNKLKSKCKVLGRGITSIVYEYKNFAIKVLKPRSNLEKNDTHHRNDHVYLESLQECEHIPRLFFYIPTKLLVIEKIDGVVLDKVPFLLCPTENIENTIRSFFNYCIDRGICPIDVHQENIIIGYNGKMYIFDVGAFAKLELFPNYASLIGWQLFNLNKHLKKIT